MTKKFVDTGKLPPVKERLPKEPMVFKTANMPDGIGVYGDTMRHVIGGRPQGWNFLAGHNQGWGGIDIGMYECLTRTGPLFEVKADELQPMPNLAKSWEWSEDGHQLTMHLIEGAKWSDGVPFTSEDVMFYWEDNIVDPNVTPLQSAPPPKPSARARRSKALDDYTIQWTFKDSRSRRSTSIRWPTATSARTRRTSSRPQHPKYNEGTTYEQYKNVPAGVHELSRCWAPGCRSSTVRTTSSSCAAIRTTGRSTRRATSCPIWTKCTTSSRPGPIATCRRWPAPATSPTSSSRKTTSSR